MKRHHMNHKYVATLMLALAVPAGAMATTAEATAAPRSAKVTAMFVSPTSYETIQAVTYDQSIVRRGSRVEVLERPNDTGGLIIELSVWGLIPKRPYDAFVYTRPCGAVPASVGKRVQDGPSTDHYPQNEVWLDFKTNLHGTAHSRADQNWPFKVGQANSVVLLSHNGARAVACVTVPFK